MDAQRFAVAREEALSGERKESGIGTLGERSLHRILKYYYEPMAQRHEIPVGKYIADILNENGIVEIQTGNFHTIRKKLSDFLTVGRVTLVFPVAQTKYLVWADPESGTLRPPRKSPRKGGIYDIVPELYKIKNFLPDKNLHFRIALLCIDEYRYLNGWSDDKKRGSSRFERIPRSLCGEIAIDGLEDYLVFLPDSLPEKFTSADLKAHAKISAQRAGMTLHILHSVGLVARTGKRGRSYEYQIQKEPQQFC